MDPKGHLEDKSAPPEDGHATGVYLKQPGAAATGVLQIHCFTIDTIHSAGPPGRDALPCSRKNG